jgi:hypothetical protein
VFFSILSRFISFNATQQLETSCSLERTSLLNAEGGQYVLQMEEMTASDPQPSRPQRQPGHDDLEVCQELCCRNLADLWLKTVVGSTKMLSANYTIL